MNIKNSAFTIILLIMTYATASAQNAKDSVFTGALSTQDHYNALYILNDSNTKKIQGILRNIKNVLNDPRLKGKLKIELVVFGDGVELFKKTNHFDTTLLKLKEQGVILAQCSNTLKEKKIEKTELWPFIDYVPTGNGEIVIRHYQGWATVHP